MFKKTNNQKKERENNMKNYEVKFNSQKIVVKDNTQSMMKSPYHMNKSYITKTNKNSFVMNMIAKILKIVLSKQDNFIKTQVQLKLKKLNKQLLQ